MNIVVVNSIPTDVPDWCDFFNLPNFYNLHKTSASIFLCFKLEDKLIGLCHFTETESGTYRSPYRGTYGNINFKHDLDLELKYSCVTELLKFLKTIPIKKIEIVSEPFSHNLHNSNSLFNIYLNKGFAVSNQEINHSLMVDEKPLSDKMMRNNKKRLNKCERENFVFEQVFSNDEINQVYKTIQENREAKGYKVSMSLTQIIEMYAIFPNALYFFKVSQNKNCAASAVCIKLNSMVLYVFYWGDIKGYEQYSPVVYLANGIYNFAQQNHFKLIDAGTSSISGEPNFGVTAFKENLGFTISSKLTYSKEL